MSARPALKFIEISKTRHGSEVVYFRRNKGARVRLPSLSSPDFTARYHDAMAGRLVDVREMPVTAMALRKRRVEIAMRDCLRGARTRSRKRKLQFDLTLNWLLEQVREQGFRCKLTGIEFFAIPPHRGKINPYVPSLDRIEPAKGYTQSNIRVVVRAVNMMLLDWGPLVFEQVARSYRHWQVNGKGKSIPAPCHPTARTEKRAK